jgi:hypothetical protein
MAALQTHRLTPRHEQVTLRHPETRVTEQCNGRPAYTASDQLTVCGHTWCTEDVWPASELNEKTTERNAVSCTMKAVRTGGHSSSEGSKPAPAWRNRGHVSSRLHTFPESRFALEARSKSGKRGSRASRGVTSTHKQCCSLLSSDILHKMVAGSVPAPNVSVRMDQNVCSVRAARPQAAPWSVFHNHPGAADPRLRNRSDL